MSKAAEGASGCAATVLVGGGAITVCSLLGNLLSGYEVWSLIVWLFWAFPA
jgi:hypothetical protein